MTGRRIRKVSLDSALSGRPELHCEAHTSTPSPSQPSVGKDNCPFRAEVAKPR